MRITSLTICIVFTMFCTTLRAQDIVVPSEVNPAEISDAQLEKAVDKAEASGYSETQILNIARAKGMSESQISELRTRISQLNSQGSNSQLDESQLRAELEDYGIDLEDLDITNKDNDEIGGAIFGAQIFNNSALSFSPSVNIPTPENYVLGAGDELIIDIWGASEKTYQLLIGPEGVVKIPNLGPVFLSGLSIEEASSRLLKRLTKIYAGLNDTNYGDQNTYGQVTLGSIRSIKVNVIGEVKNPGTYTISSMSNVLHALFRAGGPARDGTYRDIQVYRSGKLITTFDIYDFLLKGETENNVSLRDQDVIRVPYYGKRVKIGGEIKNSAIFELKDTESLQTIINYAGGVTDEAYTKLVTIRRTTENARKILTIKNEDFNNFELESGDEIRISRIVDIYENLVTIKGSVYRPGEYEYTKGLKLSELIIKAEGITADVFRDRGQVVRSNKDLTLRNIEFDIDNVLSGVSDFELQANDVVIISSIFDLRGMYSVSVQGEVRDPKEIRFHDSLTVEDVIMMAGGFTEQAAKSFVEVARRTKEDNSDDFLKSAITYQFPVDKTLKLQDKDGQFLLEPFDVVTIRQSPFFNPYSTVSVVGQVKYSGKYVIQNKNERVSDILLRSGGTTELAYLKGGRLLRDGAEISGVNFEVLLKKPGSDADIYVKDGDEIIIPKISQIVVVSGEVFEPGTTVFDTKDSFKDVISQMGGFTDNARKKRAFVSYPNGRKASTKSFLWFKDYPKIEPGSRVVIPSKPANEGISAERIMSLSTGLLTMLLIVDRISR